MKLFEVQNDWEGTFNVRARSMAEAMRKYASYCKRELRGVPKEQKILRGISEVRRDLLD